MELQVRRQNNTEHTEPEPRMMGFPSIEEEITTIVNKSLTSTTSDESEPTGCSGDEGFCSSGP